MHLRHKSQPTGSAHRRQQLLTTVEYRHFQLLRIINLITLFIFGVILGVAGMFLYNKIYTVIGQAQNILTLDQSVNVGSAVDFQLLEQTLLAYDAKYQSNTAIGARNPFDLPAAPVAATSTTVTSSPQ